MITKEELLKRLRNDPTYRDALKMAKTGEERQRVIAVAEGFLSQFFDSVSPIASHIKQDPAATTQLVEALNGNAPLIRESDGAPIEEPEKEDE